MALYVPKWPMQQQLFCQKLHALLPGNHTLHVPCLQIGENACVYELAHKALADDTLSETSRRDITLSLVAAHCNAARDLFQEEKVGMGTSLHWNAY